MITMSGGIAIGLNQKMGKARKNGETHTGTGISPPDTNQTNRTDAT